MDRTDVVTSISVALSEVLQKDFGSLDEQTRLFDDLNLDSTTVIQLLMALEDVLGVEFDPDSLVPEYFASIGSLTDFVLSIEQSQAA